MPVDIMETLHGKASALSAGEREHVQRAHPESRDKTQGRHNVYTNETQRSS